METETVQDAKQLDLLCRCAHQVLYRVQLAARFVKDEAIEDLARQLTRLLQRYVYLQLLEEHKGPSYLNFGIDDIGLTEQMLVRCDALAGRLDDLGFGRGYLEQARLAENLGNDDIIFIVCDHKLQNVLLFAGLRNKDDEPLPALSKVLAHFDAARAGLPFNDEFEAVLDQTDPETEEPYCEHWLERIAQVLAKFNERREQLEGRVVDVCDFCGDVLTGAGYDRLADGRARCLRCSKSLVKTEEDFKSVFYSTLELMQACFGIHLVPRFKLRMVNSKQLHKQIGKRFAKKRGQVAPRTLGFAKRNRDGSYELYIENGSPRLALVSTLVHELTHIWQYENWDEKQILQLYGATNRLPVYEGMAVWAQVQYLFFTKEFSRARREFVESIQREDEYGIGFRTYFDRYSMDYEGQMQAQETPFDNPQQPL